MVIFNIYLILKKKDTRGAHLRDCIYVYQLTFIKAFSKSTRNILQHLEQKNLTPETMLLENF